MKDISLRFYFLGKSFELCSMYVLMRQKFELTTAVSVAVQLASSTVEASVNP